MTRGCRMEINGRRTRSSFESFPCLPLSCDSFIRAGKNRDSGGTWAHCCAGHGLFSSKVRRVSFQHLGVLWAMQRGPSSVQSRFGHGTVRGSWVLVRALPLAKAKRVFLLEPPKGVGKEGACNSKMDPYSCSELATVAESLTNIEQA